MKMTYNLALMGLGAGAVLAYQKYKKPVMESMKKTFNKTTRMVDDKLENMM